MYPDDFLQVYMGSNHLHYNFSHRVTVRDWRQNNEAATYLLTQLSTILNSNEEFAPDYSFTFDLTHIRLPRGSGKRKLRSLD